MDSASTSLAAAAQIVVSTAQELKAALATATGGETIILKAGNYGSVSLTGGKDMPAALASGVTIRSEDVHNQATFAGLTLHGVSNLKFESVAFDYKSQTGAVLSIAPFSLLNVSGVSIVNCTFDGDVATGLGAGQDGYGTGYGLAVDGSSNVTIRGNEFFNFNRGAVISNSTGVRVVNNNLHDLSSDGLDFANVDGVLIKGNHIHDFYLSPTSDAHPDMIQFWTTGTVSPSTNIKILNNFLDMGNGVADQSIFMRNELVDSGAAGTEMFYRNVEISGNVIRNGHYHGITVGETIGLSITNNTVLQALTTAEGGSVSVPSINVAEASQSVTVTGNVMPAMSAPLRTSHIGWTVANNLFVQIDNPKAANYAGHLFADPFDHHAASVFDFRLVDGALADRLGAGASWMTAASDSRLSGYILTHESSSGGYIIENFDASHLFLNQTAVDMTGAQVTWNFGDGTVGSGLTAGHVYERPGEYTATARVVLADGSALGIDKTFTVHSANFLDVDFSSGFSDVSRFANKATASGATLVTGLPGGNTALRLNGGTVGYDSNSDFVFNKEFTILADFKKDAGHELEGGRLIYLSGSFVVSIGADSVTAQIFTTAGLVTLTASGIGVSDTDWHRIGVTFSGDTGRARLSIDGVVIDRAGGLADAVEIGTVANDLYLGGPFGGSFGGLVDNVHFLGESLLARDVAAANPLAAWARTGAAASPVVTGYLAGLDSVDLTATMTPTEIADLFSNSYSGLLSGTDFQII